MDLSNFHIAFENVYLTVHTLLFCVGLGINIAIFFKQRQSNCSLWRFRRNVISPLGSFSSFLVSYIYNLPVYYIFLSITLSGPSVLGELHLFSSHCVYFFWLNFVETICSPTLRASIINVLSWSRHEYNVAIV